MLAWLELPYYVHAAYGGKVEVPLWSRTIEVEVRLRNDLLRLDTWNRWTDPLPAESYAGGLGEAWIDPLTTDFRFAPRYCAPEEVASVAAQLRELGAPYVHAEETETVVELRGMFPGRLPDGPWDDLWDMMPLPHFWTSIVLPHVGRIIDAYRIAIVPTFRYAIHPVSEALVSSGVVELRDRAGKVVQQVRYGFDARDGMKGYDHVLERHGVGERFNDLIERVDTVEYENEMSVAYCLFQMRRWSESLAIASSVVDALLREAVFRAASSELSAKLLWDAYRSRFEDLFKRVLPSLGLGKLPDEDSDLWERVKTARQARSLFVHGKAAPSFQVSIEQQTRIDLAALAGAARWISLQLGREWALDIPDSEQSIGRLPEFP